MMVPDRSTAKIVCVRSVPSFCRYLQSQTDPFARLFAPLIRDGSSRRHEVFHRGENVMRALLIALLLSLVSSFSSFDSADARSGIVSVRGYTTSRGTHVTPHYRTAPNSTRLDNWSTKGNVNPFTVKPGTKGP